MLISIFQKKNKIILLLILFITIAFVSSCTPGSTKTESINENDKSVDTLAKKSSANFFAGSLHTLYMDSSEFNKDTTRVVFRFYANTPDTLALRGWTNDSDVFQDLPDLSLTMGAASTFQFGAKTYFGNLVLRKANRKAITRMTRRNPGFKWVLFLPHDPSRPNYPRFPPGQITYDIELTNDDPQSFFKDSSLTFASTPTFFSLNPSPPRNP